MKTLIVYYSYGGNTRQIAALLQKQLGAETLELQTVVPYTGSYESVVDQGQDEVSRGYLPELRPLEKDPADYDTILLGTPVWWYTCAPAMKSFLHGSDLAGKRVYPFMTNGGWLGHTEKDLAAACPGARMGEGIDIKFDGARLSTPADAIRRWADRIG